MKNQQNSIKAICDGLKDGGAEIYTNFPGFMSHKLFSELGGHITSINEKTAFEIAWGASLGGKRSVVMFKNVGLDDAADSFLNSHLVGVNAGMVVVVFDDVQVEGSQSRLDSRHYNDFFSGLWLEPYNLQNAYDLSYTAFELSEKIKLPVTIRVTNQLIQQTGTFKRKRTKKTGHKLVKDHQRFVVHPTNWLYQQNMLNKKHKIIQNTVESITRNINKNLKNGRKIAVIFGCNDHEEKALGAELNKIRVVTYPIPKKFLKEKLVGKKNIVCLEQGDSYGWEKLSLVLNNHNITSNTGYIPDNSKGYIISKDYEKLFLALKKVKPDVVTGDLGLYTRDSLDTIDACLCFGSSLSIGCGLKIAGINSVFSIIGDGAFLHSGKNVIPEAITRKLNLNIVVILNGGSQVTGGQIIPGNPFDLPSAVKKYELSYSGVKTATIIDTLLKMTMDKGVSVLYIKM